MVSNLDDKEKFTLIHHFRIPAIYTWGDRDVDKREEIRRIALKYFPTGPYDFEWYGFRIKVKRKVHGRDLDLENVPKLIIDAFSGWQIDRDRSTYPKVEIYKDDHLRWVRVIQIEGEFTRDEENTEVWVFGRKKKNVLLQGE